MQAIILAGGAGVRMRPLTYLVPKALLPVGGKPLLERTIQYLNSYGIKEFIICVAYLKRQIISTIGDGSNLGVTIQYAETDMPLGTAGQLKSAEPFVKGRFLAMNGDIVTSVNISNLLSGHESGKGIGTIALKKFEIKIPYGYITCHKNGMIQRFEEKPTLSFMANAGIYVFESRMFEYIPEQKICSLETEIFPALISRGEFLNSYFENAYWADVGSMTDFERVNDEILTNGELIHLR
jgi:NDP-sugar pyrophosphorylase family protein